MNPNNVFINESMSFAKVVTRNERRKPSFKFTEIQEKEIIENVTKRNLERIKKRAPESPSLNEREQKIISLEEKNLRVSNELDRMSRTLGIRVGRIGMIESTKAKLIELGKLNLKLSKDQQKAQTLKALAQNFILSDLKLSKQEYANTNVVKVWQEERSDCEIINVTFKTKADIAKINSNLKNLNYENKNKVYQYVPNSLLKRFKGFEAAAYKLRIDNQNGVNTKIRAGKKDFVLLVRPKNDKTPWSQIQQTLVPVEMDARFEVGIISQKDLEIERSNERNMFNNLNFKQHNSVLSHNIFNLLSNEESIDQFLVQNTVEAEEDQLLVENMDECINNGLEKTINENQFVADIDSTLNNVSTVTNTEKRKSLSRSSSPILRSNRKSVKNAKIESEEIHD